MNIIHCSQCHCPILGEYHVVLNTVTEKKEAWCGGCARAQFYHEEEQPCPHCGKLPSEPRILRVFEGDHCETCVNNNQTHDCSTCTWSRSN